ncbi:hypothetical protein COL27_30095, partial [Bacillus sp. AFS075960]
WLVRAAGVVSAKPATALSGAARRGSEAGPIVHTAVLRAVDGRSPLIVREAHMGGPPSDKQRRWYLGGEVSSGTGRVDRSRTWSRIFSG